MPAPDFPEWPSMAACITKRPSPLDPKRNHPNSRWLPNGMPGNVIGTFHRLRGRLILILCRPYNYFKVKLSSRGSNIVNFAESGVLFRTAPPAERMRPPLVAHGEPLPKHIEKRLLPYWPKLDWPRGMQGRFNTTPGGSVHHGRKVNELLLRD